MKPSSVPPGGIEHRREKTRKLTNQGRRKHSSSSIRKVEVGEDAVGVRLFFVEGAASASVIGGVQLDVSHTPLHRLAQARRAKGLGRPMWPPIGSPVSSQKRNFLL